MNVRYDLKLLGAPLYQISSLNYQKNSYHWNECADSTNNCMMSVGPGFSDIEKKGF